MQADFCATSGIFRYCTESHDITRYLPGHLHAADALRAKAEAIYSQNMPRGFNRKKFLATVDLSVECPHCHQRLGPAEQDRINNDGIMRCRYRKQEFDPKPIGSSGQP